MESLLSHQNLYDNLFKTIIRGMAGIVLFKGLMSQSSSIGSVLMNHKLMLMAMDPTLAARLRWK